MQWKSYDNQPTRSLYTSEKQDVDCTLALIAAVRQGEANQADLTNLPDSTTAEQTKAYGCVACMASLIDQGKPYIQGDTWCDLPEPALTQVKEVIAATVPKPRTQNR